MDAAAPDEADMALIDGDSWEATLELANPAHDDLKLIWIGDNPPPGPAWCSSAPAMGGRD
jgi:hypothetical protein